MFYERKIKYLDYYEGQERVKGSGFVKLEARDGTLRMEVAVTGLHHTDTFVREVMLCAKGRERLAGKIEISGGKGQYRQLWHNLKDIGDTGIDYGELQGIRIPLGAGREIVCRWPERGEPEREKPAEANGRRKVEKAMPLAWAPEGGHADGRAVEVRGAGEAARAERGVAEAGRAEYMAEEIARADRAGEEIAWRERREEETARARHGEEATVWAWSDGGAAQTGHGKEGAAQAGYGEEEVAQAEYGEDKAAWGGRRGEEAARAEHREDEAAWVRRVGEETAQAGYGEEEAAQAEYGEDKAAWVRRVGEETARAEHGEDEAVWAGRREEGIAQAGYREEEAARVGHGEVEAVWAGRVGEEAARTRYGMEEGSGTEREAGGAVRAGRVPGGTAMREGRQAQEISREQVGEEKAVWQGHGRADSSREWPRGEMAGIGMPKPLNRDGRGGEKGDSVLTDSARAWREQKMPERPGTMGRGEAYGSDGRGSCKFPDSGAYGEGTEMSAEERTWRNEEGTGMGEMPDRTREDAKRGISGRTPGIGTEKALDRVLAAGMEEMSGGLRRAVVSDAGKGIAAKTKTMAAAVIGDGSRRGANGRSGSAEVRSQSRNQKNGRNPEEKRSQEERRSQSEGRSQEERQGQNEGRSQEERRSQNEGRNLEEKRSQSEGRSQEGGRNREEGRNRKEGRNLKGERKQVRLMEDKWAQLWSIYPHIRPFQDDREYLSIEPSDFVLFPASSYRIVNNSFLLHGYYNYRHLLLARMERKGDFCYYIGVPGNFYEREKQVAIMFGFESFECAEEPAQPGDFGYYMMKTEI